jgi:hypothetical protein
MYVKILKIPERFSILLHKVLFFEKKYVLKTSNNSTNNIISVEAAKEHRI